MDAANLRESLNTSLQTLGTEAAARLPGLIVALLLLIAGWVIARIARSAVQRLLDSVQKSIARRSGRPETDSGAERVSARVLSGVVFWAVILLFAATATQIIGLDLFTKWMASIVKHVPGVAAGLIIIAAGFVASGFVGDLVRSSARRLRRKPAGRAGPRGADGHAADRAAGRRRPDRPRSALARHPGRGCHGRDAGWRGAGRQPGIAALRFQRDRRALHAPVIPRRRAREGDGLSKAASSTSTSTPSCCRRKPAA